MKRGSSSKRRTSIEVLDHEAWSVAGRELAKNDPQAFRRLLIAADSLVRLAHGADEREILAATLPQLEASDGMLS